MKKIFITFMIFLAYNSYAFGDCSIKQTPKELKNYVQDINKMISNVNKKAISQAKQTNDKMSDIEAFRKMQELQKETLRGLNIIYGGWGDSYEYDFENILNKLKFNENNIYVQRDIKMLNSYMQKLSGYISKSVKGKYAGELVKKSDICEGISKCMINGDLKVSDFYMQIKLSLEAVMKTIEAKGKISGNTTINEELLNSIQTNYNSINIDACEKETKGSFENKSMEQIFNISENQKKGKDAMQKWQEAWDMLLGHKIDRNLERKLLINELKKQGVSEDGIRSMVSNLDKYNYNGGITHNDNYLTNTFTNITNSIIQQIDSFSKNLEQYFLDENRESVPINTIISGKKEIENSFIRKTEIEKMYKINEVLINTDDGITDTILIRIATMHTYLSKSIENLGKTTHISEKVCNDQCSGKGKCTYK